MDEQNQAAEVVETPEPQTPEPQPEPDVQPETEQEGEDEEKGASQRIRELSHNGKVKDEKIRSLQDRISELTGDTEQPTAQVPQYNPQEPLVQPGEELDANELNRRMAEREQRILQTAQYQAELKTRQIDAENRHRTETSQALRDYPQLDPKSKEFDRELSDTVTEAVENHLRVNPYSASVKKFVDKLMKPYRHAVDRQVGQATEQMARQVSEAALRPTSVKKQEKTAGDKSIAELEAELGVVNS
jgi:hypothetical protein